MSTAAQANDELVVYIECNADGKISKGSGVLVSAQGHVLTAKHVVPDGASCQASVGNNTIQMRGIRKSFESRKIDTGFDALLMEFGKHAGEVFPYASVCSVTEALKGKDIIAKGFDQESFGAPDTNDGTLSNTAIDFNGMVQTTAETINGKSGGPVFLKDTDNIVGIVAGAQFNAQGVVSSYKMLAMDAVLTDLSLLSQAQDCAQTAAAPEPEVSDAEKPAATGDVQQMAKEITFQAPFGVTDLNRNSEGFPLIPSKDPDEKIEFVMELNPFKTVPEDKIEICLVNETDSSKRVRIAGEEILTTEVNNDLCKLVHKGAGFMQFHKEEIPGEFHLMASYTIPADVFAGQILTFFWYEED